jgi:hypothetical protein
MANFPHPVPAPALLAPSHVRHLRLQLADGAETTLHVATYAPARTALRVVRLRRQEPLASFCARRGLSDAIVGGFYVRPSGAPLGELRTRGLTRGHVPFDAPWGDVRACVHVQAGRVVVDRRDRLPAEPRGDLLQAGPLLVHGGSVVLGDEEGFSAGARQFDSDITDGRHPRAALGVAPDRLLAVACDGRAGDEAGLTLVELAEALVALGARSGLNLDGGGSTSLVCGGELVNVPREQHGHALDGGRAITTALVFAPR